MAVPATAAWNALVGNAIMRESKLRGLGVAAGVELFNAMLAEVDQLKYGHSSPKAHPSVLPGPLLTKSVWLSDAECRREHGAPNASRLLKLQIIRAIACNIVKHRDFYPTKEVLLKHALGYLGMLDEFKGEDQHLHIRRQWGGVWAHHHA